MSHVVWRCVLGKVLARRGEAESGEGLVREALALVEPTDFIDKHADVLVDLAEVLRLSRRSEEAPAALRVARLLSTLTEMTRPQPRGGLYRFTADPSLEY